jgi:hypothetical protein
MKIKRFNESEEVTISNKSVQDLVKRLGEFSSQISENLKMVESLHNELNNYKSLSTKSNNQIDDSISLSQLLQTSINDCKDYADKIIENLNSYTQEGSQYLYTKSKKTSEE